MTPPFVDIQNLTVTFTGGKKPVHAVGGVDLQVERGEVVALIGESGSGKSVTLRSLLRLHAPRRTQIGGQMMVGGLDVLALSPSALAQYRGKTVAMIFQEPLLALDPVYTLGAQIVESIRRHEPVSRQEARQRALQLFERVRIPSPERRLDAYPHEMSGGMNQRVMIAMAMACEPRLLIADEPTTALDVTIQAQVMDLLAQLQRDRAMSLVLITHDLAVVAEMAQRVAVMYAGQVVESAATDTLFDHPRHPYTHALLAALPEHNKGARRLSALRGVVPGRYDRPAGCLLAPRCAFVQDRCRAEQPPLQDGVRCFFPLQP